MITAKKLLEVEFVQAEENYCLIVHFNDGQVKKVDLTSLVSNPPPVFKKLANRSEFEKVSVNAVGGIQWECGADLSADYLFDL